MLEMFCDGVVVLLPAIQRSMTLETCCVIGIRLIRFVVESGVRQLEALLTNANADSRFLGHKPQLAKVAGVAMRRPLAILYQKICASPASKLCQNWPGGPQRYPFRSPWRIIGPNYDEFTQTATCRISEAGEMGVVSEVALLIASVYFRCYANTRTHVIGYSAPEEESRSTSEPCWRFSLITTLLCSL